MQRILRYVQPDWRKLVLFALLIAIAAGGKIQAYAFSGGPDKPLLYDLLRPFPIWPLWMFLLLPLALLSWPLRLAGVDPLHGPAWLFIAANIAYFYLLSCLVVVAVDWLRTRWRVRKLG